MPGIWDAIQSFLGMQPQQQPAGQATQQAPYQPPSGTLLEALGVPLALFGAYEAARGRPIGAPAGLAGAGLSYLGNQRNANATAYSAFEAALQAAQKRAPVGSGVQEQLRALEPVGQADPTEGINETKEVLKQYFESQKGKKLEEKTIGGHAYSFDPQTGKMTQIPGIIDPATKFPVNPVQQIIDSHPEWAKLSQADQLRLGLAEAQRNKIQLAATTAGARMAVEPGTYFDEATGTYKITNKANLMGRESKAPEAAPKIAGYIGSRATDGGGGFVYRPAPTTGLKSTIGAKAAKLLGGGKAFRVFPDGTKVMDGDIIPGTGIRWRAE